MVPSLRFCSLVVGLLGGLALLAPAPAPAEDAAPSSEVAPAAMSPAEIEAVEQVVHDYLMAHPEVILEAVQALKDRGAQQAVAEQRKAIAERRDELLRDSATPVAGNPEGGVSVVEFFDYQCPYCKSVAAELVDTLENEGDVRIVFKEFPILGAVSEFAAKAALAAERQGHYLDFHLALMAFKGKLTEKAVLDIAERTGLDLGRLKKDMDAPEIAAAIDRNLALADALQVRGTPAFVIGDHVEPGAIPMDRMRELVKAQRGS